MRHLLAIAAALLIGAFLAAPLSGLSFDRWIDEDPDLHAEQAAAVRRWITADLDAAGFSTGHDLFDGEWLFGTHQMAGLAFGQLARLHPEDEAKHLASMEVAIDALLSPSVQAFDARRWGGPPLDFASDRHHASYRGYAGLVLGLHRSLRPDSRYAATHDALAAALARDVLASPTGFLLTYPGEVYPVDNAAVVGSLALHAAATGTDHSGPIDRLLGAIEGARAPDTGLLHQSVTYETGTPHDLPRGSGTALAAYFLGLGDLALGEALADSVHDELAGGWLGFGLVREYARGVDGRGDIDSGPVIAGWGISATGFSLACARLRGDDVWLGRLGRTTSLFGGPSERGWRTGGPLGNAILLAMLTAPKGGAP